MPIIRIENPIRLSEAEGLDAYGNPFHTLSIEVTKEVALKIAEQLLKEASDGSEAKPVR